MGPAEGGTRWLHPGYSPVTGAGSNPPHAAADFTGNNRIFAECRRPKPFAIK
jgi:hypothetical protein